MNKWIAMISLVLAPSVRAQDSLDLRDAVSRALAHGAEWRAALATDQEASAATRIVGDSFHPQVFLTTTPGYSSGLAVAIAGRLPAIASVDAQETFYDPARKSDLLNARAREANARGTLGESRSKVVSAVIQAYTKVWLDTNLERSARIREEAQVRLLSQAEALSGEGRLLPIDLERARLGLATAKQQRLDADSDRDLDSLELAHLTGDAAPLPVLREDLLEALPEAPTEGSLAAAQGSDPRIRGFSAALEATEQARRERDRRFLPVVQAEAQYARLYRTPSYDEFYRTYKADDWSIGVSIAIPLFSGGRASDAALQSRATYDRLESQRKQREMDLELGVDRALEGQGRTRARTSLARRALSIAEESLSLVRRLKEEGRSEEKDVAAASLALCDAQDDLARAIAEEVSARADLLALRGELLSALGISTAS